MGAECLHTKNCAYIFCVCMCVYECACLWSKVDRGWAGPMGFMFIGIYIYIFFPVCLKRWYKSVIFCQRIIWLHIQICFVFCFRSFESLRALSHLILSQFVQSVHKKHTWNKFHSSLNCFSCFFLLLLLNLVFGWVFSVYGSWALFINIVSVWNKEQNLLRVLKM